MFVVLAPHNIKVHFFAIHLYFSISLLSFPILALDLSASGGYIPVLLENSRQGPFIDLIKAIDKNYTDGDIRIHVSPFSRSLYNVSVGQADFHVPLVVHPKLLNQNTNLRYISETIGKSAFVIYSHKDKPITRELLLSYSSSDNFPYRIETERAGEALYPFTTYPVYTIAQGLKRVASKRIDGYISIQEAVDMQVRALNLNMIHRSIWEEFDYTFVVAKTLHGEQIDKILSDTIRNIRNSDESGKTLFQIHQLYKEWQPYDELQ